MIRVEGNFLSHSCVDFLPGTPLSPTLFPSSLFQMRPYLFHAVFMFSSAVPERQICRMLFPANTCHMIAYYERNENKSHLNCLLSYFEPSLCTSLRTELCKLHFSRRSLMTAPVTYRFIMSSLLQTSYVRLYLHSKAKRDIVPPMESRVDEPMR